MVSNRLRLTFKEDRSALLRRVLLQDFLALLAEVLGSWPPAPCFVLSGRWGNTTEAAGGPRCGHWLVLFLEHELIIVPFRWEFHHPT